MRILFLGDIVGKSGRQIISSRLPQIITDFSIHMTIANAENAAHGFGLSKKIAYNLFDLGIDAITLGNHAFDNQDIYSIIDDPRIIRPHNIGSSAPGKGVNMLESRSGHRVLVANILGSIFMNPTYENPWRSADAIIPKSSPVASGFDAVVVDFHCEATSEKQAMGLYLDGQASIVVGTHTHIPTSDYRVLPSGTAYITDVGMCGSYDSVIGMDKDIALKHMLGIFPKERHTPADNLGTISGIIIETDEKTGLALSIKNIIVGSNLLNSYPKS